MITVGELAEASGARVLGPVPALPLRGFAYDSRADCRGRIFVAIRTENGDGHDYIGQAAAAGAGAVLCADPPVALPHGIPLLVVPDVVAALGEWATASVRAWQPTVVAVTGSLGKTTTKELAAAVLRQRYSVAASPGNYSGRLGLPVALAEMDRTANVAVLEFASDGFGEMAALCSMAPPDYLVVTNVCEPHIEVFETLENTAAEMTHAVERLGAGGCALLNCDDRRVMAMASRSPQALCYGTGGGELRARAVRMTPNGLEFEAGSDGMSLACRSPLRSPAMVHDCLAALAVGLAMGVPLADGASALATAGPVPGRLNPVRGRGGTVILDDTFSACPTSTLAALSGLEAHHALRRHLVLGDLDSVSGVPDWARQLGAACSRAACHLWALGDVAAEVAQFSGDPTRARVYYSRGELSAALERELDGGDVVLVKGNRASRLERLVADLAEPGAGHELVRQESYWGAVRLARPQRPTWVEVDVEALARNTRLLRQACATPVMAVLKADAYGHGAVRAARIVVANGADSVAVATVGEARALRDAGVACEVLILGYTPPWQAREAVRAGAACTVFGREEALALAHAADAMGVVADVHVKVDTGMARLGLRPEETPAFIASLMAMPSVRVRGVFTHFGGADEPDDSYTRLQLDRFLGLLQALERAGLRPPVAHAANTAAALSMPESRLDLVRLGIGLYGIRPGPTVPLPDGCAPVMAFKTTVAQVKAAEAGTYVGYGRGTRLTEGRTIAVIPVGYADGFRRAPRHWAEVLIRGRRCPIIGNVCMDQAMVDVTGVPAVAKGDEVVLIGRQGDVAISADEVAERLGTIPYEVVSAILARVPRMA